MEIERKFLFKNIPFDLNNYDCFYMEQAYISTNPVIRIRSKEDCQEESEEFISGKIGGRASQDRKRFLYVWYLERDCRDV